MSLRIYQNTAGRQFWSESTSPETVRNLASGKWVLFDDTPDSPPPAPDGFDSAVRDRIAGTSTLTRGALRTLVATDAADATSAFGLAQKAATRSLVAADAADAASAIGAAQKAATRSLVAADTANPASAIGAAQRAAYVPKWKPNTAYASGEFVLNPSGQIVSANTAFTSSASYSSSNWTVVSSGGGSGSGLPATFVTKTSAYTAVVGDFVQADATTAAFTVTLPAAPSAGALVTVKKVDGTGNIVTVVAASSGTVDGDTSAQITSPQFGAIFEHVGSNVWRIVAPTSAGGSNGVNGNTVRNGTGAPASGIGTDGDFYIDTAASRLYGPKAAGAWPGSFTSLIGPTGSGSTPTIQDEGSALTVRSIINFVGLGVTATDDSANTRTVVTIPGSSGAFSGDGSDGAVTADGAIAIPGASLSGSTYTLSRNVYYSTLTVNSGVTIRTNGWILNVQGALTNNGTIHNNGGIPGVGAASGAAQTPATDGSGTGNLGGGAGATAVMLGYGRAGGIATGTAGTSVTASLGGAGGAGGSASGGASAGGAGGTVASEYRDATRSIQYATAGLWGFGIGAATTQIMGGAGGGGANNDGTNQGGGGGGGGGVLVLNARTITNNGAIQARGAKGANAVAGNSGGGGGGGGGVVLINTTSYSGTGSYDASGGAAGTAQGTGANGVAGSNGIARLNVWS